MSDTPLFDPPEFDGDTFDPFVDGIRLSSQLSLVASVMADGAWWTIPGVVNEIRVRHAVRCSDTGVSARIRDFRKPRHGSHQVERRRVNGGGLWEYRVVIPTNVRRP